MILIAGTVRLHPQQREAAVAHALRMAQATHAEAGCLAYTFSADLADPDVFHIFEAWGDEAALRAHFQTPHMAEFNRQLPTLVAAAPQLQKYQVSSSAPF
ncbi:putative quinol monooxygenase [Deinococcus ruber]|uniref:Antibiotic biosynthesis monooxygenase n=1 Tax=Deinococcus ruber TaxID=1848197 RepID=A0A918FFG4_9DEIO|nr:putative quinol monooxygenase [Deinococcus ruber]GGR34734.1 antibiotic biosynthesis monooxygenase [Deinococcus ruber]